VKTIVIHIHHPEFPLWDFPVKLGERWSERFAGPDVRLIVARGEVPFLEALPGACVLIGGGLNRETFPLARELTWVQTSSAGIGHMLFPELVESPVVVTNARGVFGPPMAEHLLGMMFSLVRKLHRSRDFQLKREWGQEALWQESPEFDELGGKTVGIVGLGSIGLELGRRARALGMRVIAVKRRPDSDPDESIEVRGQEELDWLLSQSDFVVNALPYTSRTHHLFDAGAFSKMKPGGFFLNVGRGKTVDEAALVEILERGHLAGAGLDVTYEEPLPADSPLYAMPQVLLTPHTSGTSIRFWERAAKLFQENIERYLDGRPLLNVVDKGEGY
jgi:phosphoglycerate dehydrogenase-like enzyme